MIRIWFWNIFPRIRIQALLSSQPKTFCLRHISCYANFNCQTVWCLEKTMCKLLCNKQNTDQCLVSTRMSSFLTNINFKWSPTPSAHVGSITTVLNSKHKMGVSYDCSLLLKNTLAFQQTRQYRNKKQTEEESSSSEDEYEESDEDEEHDFPLGYKDKRAFVKSLRADAIVSSGLALSRNSVDDVFLKSGLKLNGAKLLKKSKLLEEEDIVDVIIERKEDKLRIKRVKLLKVLPEMTKKERVAVKLRVWKTAFEIEDEDKTRW